MIRPQVVKGTSDRVSPRRRLNPLTAPMNQPQRASADSHVSCAGLDPSFGAPGAEAGFGSPVSLASALQPAGSAAVVAPAAVAAAMNRYRLSRTSIKAFTLCAGRHSFSCSTAGFPSYDDSKPCVPSSKLS